jgi:uncharacterized membrane protein YkgB
LTFLRGGLWNAISGVSNNVGVFIVMGVISVGVVAVAWSRTIVIPSSFYHLVTRASVYSFLTQGGTWWSGPAAHRLCRRHRWVRCCGVGR